MKPKHPAIALTSDLLDVHQHLAWAYYEIRKAIASSDDGRSCTRHAWDGMNRCEQRILAAMKSLQEKCPDTIPTVS